jgi:Down syndrome cell adhesion molecule
MEERCEAVMCIRWPAAPDLVRIKTWAIASRFSSLTPWSNFTRYKGDKLIDNQKRIEISVDNTLIIRNLNRNDEGNYMCVVANKDRIIYQLQVQVPPSPPVLQVKSTTANSIELKWRVTDNGGSQIMGFFLTYREEFGDWEELTIDYRTDQRLLENLLCGTNYQLQLSAFNKIGTGSAGAVQAQTKGSLPIAPLKQHFVRVNMTFVQLELESWQTGGCPITFFSVEHRMDGGEDNDWIIYSSNISPQPRITIGDLQPAKFYRLRVTAHNNAGAKLAEYVFKSLSKSEYLILRILFDSCKRFLPQHRSTMTPVRFSTTKSRWR